MKPLKTIILILVLLVIAIGLYAFGIALRDAQTGGTDFAESGYVVQNNPGLVPNVWHLLVYEEPGDPTLTIPLIFNNRTICVREEKQIDCEEVELENGTRATITGTLTGDSVRVTQIEVESGAQATDTVSLFYYSSEKDQDPTGNIMCSRAGLVAVERQVPLSGNREQDIGTVVRILLASELTSQEREEFGITTEYPLRGLTLEDVELTNGAATLTFNDPENKTVGGSCRVGILWFQIAETVLQFEGVGSVHFFPEELFQP